MKKKKKFKQNVSTFESRANAPQPQHARRTPIIDFDAFNMRSVRSKLPAHTHNNTIRHGRV